MPSPREAEVAAEWALIERFGCLPGWTRRALRTKFARVDFFASDVMGKREDGSMVWAQVTKAKSTANVRPRRRKLERVPWSNLDLVLLLHMRTDDSTRPHRHHFRVHRLVATLPEQPGIWTVDDELMDIPRAWFKVWAPTQDTGDER